jgi:hypothetical protein
MLINKEYHEKALLIYGGVFTLNLISVLGNHIKSLTGHHPKILQRIFRIFIEITQNVSYYSDKTVPVANGSVCGAGWVAIQEFEDHYKITTGNQIKSEHAPRLEKYCNEINSLGMEELKVLKRETRSQAMVRETGAQIGLIQISIASGNKLAFQLPVLADRHHFFILSSRVDKGQTEA